MTASKKIQVIDGRSILVADLTTAKAELTGRTVWLNTQMANETAEYTIESVSCNRETGDYAAWVVQAGVVGGKHVRIVAAK